MIKHQILLFLGFLAIASALNVTPEKNLFMLPASNGLSTQLFQTRNGIIAYSTDLIRSPDHLVPQYVQIDLETNNVTQILQDLPTACGQGPSAFDRLHYHVATYSLVYYCTNNNSILILDQDNYEVQKIVSLSINETFDEVRITTDGYSVAILGLTLQSPSPSHLVKFSLQTQKVVNHVVFDHGFADGEVVTAYDSNGNNMFIIANIFNDGVNIANVYQMTLIGNSYSLTPRVTFNTTTFYVNTLPEFYCVKNFIVTSSGTTLFILHQSGSILAEYSDLDLKEFTIGSYFDLITFWRPTIVSDDGSSDVYASFANYSLYKISAQSQGGFTFENQGIARNISVAVKDQDTNTLLFSFSQNYENFTITDLAKSEVVYQSVAQFEHFMITDKTYSVIEQLPDLSELLYIFDRQTNQVIQVFPTDRFYYYDQENSVVSRLINYQNGTFQLQQIDLRTGNFYTPLSFSFPPTDFVQLVHATNNENFDAPQLVIHDIGTSDVYLIVSQTFGQVKFINDLPASSFVSYFATNYDTLTSYYFLDMANSQSISVTEYHYDSSQNFFFSNNSNANLFAGYVMPDSDYSVITGTGELAVIDMALLKQTEYNFSTEWQSIALFQNTNSSNGVNMVLSPVPLWGTPTSSAGILYDGQIQDLPGTTSSTLQAGTAGLCSYWVVNQVGSFGNVQFYNICNNDAISEIFA